MTTVKPIIDRALDILKFVGHPFVFVICVTGLLWGAATQIFSPLLAICLAALFGFIAGFRFALAAFSYVVVKAPDQVLKTVAEWKADGRWTNLLAEIARQRRGQ